MNRQNLFSDAWDGENEEVETRHRTFWRPDDARMGATLYELAPDAHEMRMHMHFGAEEMFFDRVTARPYRPSPGPKRLRERPLRSPRSGRIQHHWFSRDCCAELLLSIW